MKYLLFSLFSLISITQLSNAQCTAVNEADSLALVDFYYAMNGENWSVNYNWTGTPIQFWEGIELTEDGCHVRSISLTSNGLNGELSNLIDDFTYLEYLDLSFNNIIGEIPSFENNTDIIYIGLRNNELTGTPPPFENNISLEYLNLSYNSISGEIPSFENNPELIYINLRASELTGVLPSFENNINLEHLDLNYNQLIGGIPSFENNEQLQYLNISENNLTGNIPNFNNNLLLEYLLFWNNELTGSIPNFENNSQLKELLLPYNDLTGSIPNFENNSQLQKLKLQGNGLTGDIPNFNNNVLLNSLDLQNNQLTGNIPSFENNSQLQFLILSSNNLNGNIPSFNNNTQLESIIISSNQLTGNIPSFENNSQLNNLTLQDNELTGNIPNFEENSQLDILDLSNNELTGNIPNFDDNYLLRRISLDGNELTGSIPNLSNNALLRTLNLNNNELTGSIPNFNYNALLRTLTLNNNELTGNIPNFDYNVQLVSLHLHYNELTGSIPELSLPDLEELYVCDNPLSGAVPTLINCPLIEPVDVDFSCIFNSKLIGQTYIDENEDCELDEEDSFMPNAIVAFDEGYYYDITDANGNFELGSDTGTHIITYFPPNEYWSQSCEPLQYEVYLETLGEYVEPMNFATQAAVACPRMEVSMGTPLLRRCFENNYTIEYCNTGTVTALDAYIELDLDEFLIPINSTLAYMEDADGNLVFELGDMEIFECGSFTLTVEVSCESELGQGHCSEVHIYPDEYCTPLYEDWAGNRIVVDLTCNEEEEELVFNISNWLFDMEEESTYYVHRNNILMEEGTFFLEAGEDTTFYQEADGATWRLEAVPLESSPQGNPIVTLEGCGEGPDGGFDIGFINSLPLGDEDHFVDMDCRENIGSYDPNDKQVFPQGATDLHCITPDMDLEYLVRFQNTGTDTAFNIYIIDTISEYLDITSLKLRASSHDYEVSIQESNILRFDFNNILLPDSNTNELASHGFIKFEIGQKDDTPMGAYISNQAHIFFDFNEAIITNKVFNTVDDCSLFVVLSVEWLDVSVEAFSEGSLVKWTVASEQNLSHYEVEKSMNGNDFQFLGRVEPKEIKQYELTDSSPISSTQYYRIKEVSLDGELSYSKVVSISPEVNLSYQLHPNPAQDFIHINFEVAQPYEIEVYDIAGQLIQQIYATSSQTMMDVSAWKEGTYLVKISNEHFVATERIGVVR